MKFISTFGLTFLFCLFSLNVEADPCHKRMGALDIGSGSTKAYAALVDTCQKRIIKPLFDERISLAFKEDLSRSPDNRISDVVIKQASQKISELIKKMRQQKVKTISGIATAAFRSAANGADAAQKISKIIKIPVQVLTQEEEALVGAKSALSQLPEKPDSTQPVIVWDIGGGSMQMWAESQSSQPHLYKGDLASISFKDQIIQRIHKQDLKKFSTPNPLRHHYKEAVVLAEKYAKTDVPEFFQKNGPRAQWLGIGGVLALSVQEQVAKDQGFFTQDDVARTLKKQSKLTDQEIGGDFSSTEASNLALVLGYMKALNLKKVETFNVSLAQGWIFHQISKE